VPTGVTATAASPNAINLAWTASTDNVGVTGYRVERCQGAGCSSFVQVGTPTGTTFNDTGLSASTSYSYRMRAADAAGNLSGFSGVQSATTPAAPDTTAPTAPTALTATAVSASQVNLAWSASIDNVGVTGYRVERCQGAGCSNFVQIATPSGTTFNNTGLAAATSYSYRVRATDAAGNLSGYSSVQSATTQSPPDTQRPSTPNGFTATSVSSSQINLAWNASTDNVGVTGYRVERCQGAGCSNFVQIATPAGTTFNNTGLAPSTLYRYRVRAADAAGNLSNYSAVRNGTTHAASDTQPPTVPTGLTATAVSPSQINLAWSASTDNTGVTGYRVERCQGAGCSNFVQVATPTGTTFDDTGLAASTSYSYRVRAADAAGNLSGFSGLQSATTPAAPDTTPPTAPTASTATAVSASQINLAWSASTDNVGVTGYRVERCQGAGCSSFVQVAAPIGTSFNDIGLAPSTSYSYRVRAADAAGNLSGFSGVQSATTPAAADTTPPSVPTGVTATAASPNAINLAWTASTDNVGVTGYRVERCQGAGCSNFVQIATPSGTTFNDTGLAAATSYSYRVRATDAAGNLSGYSSVQSTTTHSAPSTLVAAYAFDEGLGPSAADASGNGNTGAIGSAAWVPTGKFGNALSFNGTNARVTVNDSASLDLTAAMTLEAWVFPTVGGGWRDVIYKAPDDTYYLESSSDSGRPATGGTFSPSLFGTSALPLNVWSHLAATLDAGTLRLYVNGVQVASQPVFAPISTSTGALTIGGDAVYGQYFAGRIDEVRIYNTARNATEIQSDMNTPIGSGP
jgi:chitodextrinase